MVDAGSSNGRDRTVAGLDRRQLLRRTAVVGGAMWAAPALLTVSRASAAELHSAPPSGGSGPDEVGGSVVQRPGPSSVSPPKPRQSRPVATQGGTLPRTGADIDRLVGTGLAAVAGGSLLRWWTADHLVDGAAVTNEPPGPTA